MRDESDHGDEWNKFTYSSGDGLILAGRKYGWENRDSLPLVCLAGLTRNSADFHELATYLAYRAAEPRRVLCLDYRGRGMSDYDRNWHNYNVLAETGDVIAGLVAAGIGEAAFAGTSRGGLIIFALTAIRPALLRAVLLNDVGPQVEARGLVRIKNYLDNTREFRSLEDAAKALRSIGQHQFPKWNLQMWMRQAERIMELRDGRLRPRFDRALIRTLALLDLDSPLPAMWPQFDALKTMPVMVVRGANSDILAAETLERMAARHPSLTACTVPDQGHAPDLGTGKIPGLIEKFLGRATAGRA